MRAVAAALAYDIGLKRTVWSWLPYAVAFGLLPVVVWLVSPQDGLPPTWLVLAGALLGVGAHGANVLPDYDRDRASGVLGLPQQLDPLVLRLGTATALLGALALLTFGTLAGLKHGMGCLRRGLRPRPGGGGRTERGSRLFPAVTPSVQLAVVASHAAARSAETTIGGLAS